MKIARLELVPSAWEELNAISDKHLLLSGPNSAEKITDKIFDTLEILKSNPYLGKSCSDYPIYDSSYRYLVCGVYLCFYKVIDDCVIVYHIVDGRTDYTQLFY